MDLIELRSFKSNFDEPVSWAIYKDPGRDSRMKRYHVPVSSLPMFLTSCFWGTRAVELRSLCHPRSFVPIVNTMIPTTVSAGM